MRKKTIISFLAISTLCFGAFAEDDYAVGESAAFDLCLREVALPSGAVVHDGGELAANETWAAGSVHVVYGTVIVATNATLTIEPGATVKFLGGGIIARGNCIANGATFTDIADGSGLAMPSYTLRGNFETDNATRIRFAKNGDEFEAEGASETFAFSLRTDAEIPAGAVEHGGGELAADETWAAGSVHVVYGTVVVATNATLTIEPGAVVKFLGGGIVARGNCIANGATFTDIADGGYGVSALPMPSYVLKGNIETDDATRIRFAKNGDEFAAEGSSGAFRLDITEDGYRFAHEKEEIAYSSSWGDGDGVMVAVTSPQGDTVALVDESGTASGVVEWNAPAAPGLYRFTHSSGGENLEAGFIVLDGAVVHGGTLEADETWTKDAVHIIGGNVYVPAGVVLTIESGAVVKFADGKMLSMSGGGVCVAESVVFTSIADDTAGGDTLADGGATAPRENSYMILGMVADDAKTECRYGTVALCGAIGMDTVWRKEKTYVIDGTLTVANGASLTIPPGTVVKFTNGSSLAVENGGECIAKGVVFTHIADDAVGGDTMGDGDATAPEYGKYRVDANIVEDDATEYRYYVPTTLSSSISTDTILRGNRVYVASNDVTVASGVTLTVGCGTTLKFAAGKSLRLRNGSCLIVQGTHSRPIVFTSIKDDFRGGDTNGDGDGSIPYPGDWGGVIANGARIEAEYAQFVYGGGVNGNSYGARASCFMWDNASGSFSGCRFSGSPMDGCFAQNATFANCIFDDNDRGLVSHTGTITADNCVAANNRIGFFSHTSPLVVRSSISSLNTGAAITGDGGSRETSSCYFGDDPKFLDPENGDYRIAADSPCVDAGDAAYAPEKDYYGSPRYAMSYGGEAKPDIGIHEVLPKRVASDVDLEAVEISASGETFTMGDSITVKWKVRNVGTATAQGPWTDTISAIDASGAVVALGSRTTLRNLAPGATVECEGTFRIPAMAEGWARIRVTVNSGRDVFEGTLTGNNTASSATSFNVSIPVLDTGEMMTVQVPAGSSVAFRLKPDSKAKSLLFMCSQAISMFGSSSGIPKRGMEEVEAIALSAQGSDFLVLPVPDGAAEKGFIFVIENSGMSSESVFGAEQTAAIEVYEVYPKRLAVGEQATLRVRGVGVGDVDMAILRGGNKRYGDVAQVVSPTEVLLTFNLSNVEPGMYDLYVQGKDYAFHTYKNAVEIYKPLEGPKLEARIEGPSAVRVGRIVSARIVYTNVGDMPMRAPYFMLSSDNSKFRLDGEEEWQEGYVEVMGLGPGADPSVLAPGETGSVAYEFISLGGARTRLESDADTSDYWANHADAAAAAASRLNRRGRRIVRYSELERYAEEFREHPGTSNAACGVLRDHASGEPLAGVEVCAMSEGGELLSFDTVDANGVFVLEGLPSATNLVLSVVEGAFADDLSVAMPANGDLLGLRWYGTKGWTINVSVEGATAEDFEQGVEIELLRIGDENTKAHLTLTSAVEGIAAATVKEAGVYVVRGKTKSGREQFALVECEAGATVAETVIDFSQGHSVSGVVSDTDGSGLSGVLLSLSPKGEMNGYARTVTSGADGAFSFGCMEDGEYLLSWTKNGYGSDVAMDVVVSGGDVKGLSPQCMAFGQSIIGKANTECAGMTVAFATSAGGSVTATIAEDGTFVLEGLSAGRGTFSIMDGAGNIIYMMRDLYVRPGANTLDVAAETELCNVIGATIDEEGSLVQAVWVFSSTSGDGGTGYANENGKCLVKLRKATYDVSVAADGFVTRTFRRKIDDSCKLTATLERGGCAQVAADAESCLVSFSADGIVDDGVEAQEGGTVSGAYTNGTEVTAFVVCLDKAYRTDSIVIETSATGTLSRVEGGRALTVSATGDKADVAAFRFALMGGSGFVATWPVEEGKLELTEFPRVAVKVSAVAPDGSIISSVDVAADATVASIATARALPISGCIVDDMPAMLAGGAVSFGKGDGTILATAEVTPFGTFRADYVSAAYERVWVHLPNGVVFSLSRAEAEAANFAMTPPDLDEMGLSQLQVVDENGEPVEGAEVDVETADGYETTLTTDRRGYVWIVTSVHQEPPEYKPPRLPEDPPQKQPDVKPENPASEPTPAQETKKQMERGTEFACTKCGAFPCVCKVEPPTPPEETPPEPPQDIKNICPTCGQILPCSCKDKGKETEEKNNNTNEKKPIEEEPVTLPELEDLSDSDIPDLGLSDNWDFWMHWYDNCNKELTDLRERADAVTMAPNPNYASCQSRNCNYNELLLRRFKALKAEAISAEKDAGALLELIRKEHKLLVGDAAVDVASLACDIIAARLKDKKAAAGVAFLSLGLNVGAMLNTHFRDEIMACFNAVSNVTGGPSYAHDDIIGKILGDSDFSSSSASADSLWASFASALTAGNLVELIKNAENHRTTVVSFMTRYFFEENGYVLKEGKWVLDYNYLTKARKQAVAAADKWLNNQMRLFNADNLKLTKAIRAMAVVAALAKVGDYVHRANKLDIMVKKLNEVIKQVQKKVIIAEREAKRPYHKCPCGCSPKCPCGGLCENCQCDGGGGGNNGPHPSPRNPHPPYPKPWSEPKSEDPNEVAGPLGIGERRYVKAGDEMLYTVYFENKSDASAAAQDIYITNPLSEWLDWTTFEMCDIGFNNQIDRGLDGLQSGVSEVALNNTPYFVKSSVALDESSGRIRIELHIVDKTTKYGIPEDPYAGILPPQRRHPPRRGAFHLPHQGARGCTSECGDHEQRHDHIRYERPHRDRPRLVEHRGGRSDGRDARRRGRRRYAGSDCGAAIRRCLAGGSRGARRLHLRRMVHRPERNWPPRDCGIACGVRRHRPLRALDSQLLQSHTEAEQHEARHGERGRDVQVRRKGDHQGKGQERVCVRWVVCR